MSLPTVGRIWVISVPASALFPPKAYHGLLAHGDGIPSHWSGDGKAAQS